VVLVVLVDGEDVEVVVLVVKVVGEVEDVDEEGLDLAVFVEAALARRLVAPTSAASKIRATGTIRCAPAGPDLLRTRTTKPKRLCLLT